jgi:hypothetical protein
VAESEQEVAVRHATAPTSDAATDSKGDVAIVVDGSYARTIAPLKALVTLPSLLHDVAGEAPVIRRMVSHRQNPQDGHVHDPCAYTPLLFWS